MKNKENWFTSSNIFERLLNITNQLFSTKFEEGETTFAEYEHFINSEENKIKKSDTQQEIIKLKTQIEKLEKEIIYRKEKNIVNNINNKKEINKDSAKSNVQKTHNTKGMSADEYLKRYKT